MQGVRVSLSSGDVFYIADVTPEDVAIELRTSANGSFWVPIGDRFVNPFQVAQLTVERDIPSIHTPERLEVGV